MVSEDEEAAEDVHKWATQMAGVIDIMNQYLEKEKIPYRVGVVKPASDLMLFSPRTIIVPLEPIEE